MQQKIDKFGKYFQKIDLFGVPVQVLTNKSEEKHTSFYGGFISVFVSVLSLAYFIYVLIDWINGNLAPNINLNQRAIDYSELSWEDDAIQFRLQDRGSKLDPFSRTANIITPVLFEVSNFLISKAPEFLFSDETHPNLVSLKAGTIVLNNQYSSNSVDKQPVKNYLLIFAKCNQSYLDNNGKCADQSIIDQYFNQYHGFISINIQLQQFDYKTQQLQKVNKQMYQAFSPAYVQYTQLPIQQKDTIVDDGILFTNFNSYKTINNFNIINQSIDEDYLLGILKSFQITNFPSNQISAFQFYIDNISINEEITMPKLSAVFAFIKSIISILFLLEYVAVYINNTQSKNQLLKEIIQMYFPSVQSIKLQQNIFGQIKQIEIDGKNIDDDNSIKDFKSTYQNLMNQATQKCRLVNIIYEISRLQFLFEKYLGFDKITNCHILGQEHQFIKQHLRNESEHGSILQSAQKMEEKETIFSLFVKQN